MPTEMGWALVTKGQKPLLLRMKADELARLKADFAGFKESGEPAFGSYAHYVTTPASSEVTTSESFGWLRRQRY